MSVNVLLSKDTEKLYCDIDIICTFLNNVIYGKFTVQATVGSSISNCEDKMFMHLMYTSIFNNDFMFYFFLIF